MNAKKCDRCVEFYAPYSGNIYKDGKTNVIDLQNDCGGGAIVQSIKYFDLCPACMEKQIKFLRGARLLEV